MYHFLSIHYNYSMSALSENYIQLKAFIIVYTVFQLTRLQAKKNISKLKININ